MAEAVPAEPTRFFVAVLAANRNVLPAVREALEREWGPVDLAAEVYPFQYTRYYEKEAGSEIVRTFYGFSEAFDPGALAVRKVRTNAMEKELAAQFHMAFPRPVNLDPGYLAPDKLVLASAKNFAHRIYLGLGIYAEITLLYRHKRFESLEWTFPDYASGDYNAFFLALREKLMETRDVR